MFPISDMSIKLFLLGGNKKPVGRTQWDGPSSGEAANLLYQGPWVAERLSSLTNWLQGDPEAWQCEGDDWKFVKVTWEKEILEAI